MATAQKPDLRRAARWFHALADETRLQIMECLSQGEQCVCELTEALDTSQSRLSFHLKTLKEAGLVDDRRDGRWIYYTIKPDCVKEIQQAVQNVCERPTAAKPPTRCCQ